MIMIFEHIAIRGGDDSCNTGIVHLDSVHAKRACAEDVGNDRPYHPGMSHQQDMLATMVASDFCIGQGDTGFKLFQWLGAGRAVVERVCIKGLIIMQAFTFELVRGFAFPVAEADLTQTCIYGYGNTVFLAQRLLKVPTVYMGLGH